MVAHTYIKILISWYNHDDRQLAGEETVKNMSEEDVLKLFDAPFWNHAYLCNALECKKHYNTIQKNIEHLIDPEKHSYFLEMFKIEEQPVDQPVLIDSHG